jgi:glutathione peroxidase
MKPTLTLIAAACFAGLTMLAASSASLFSIPVKDIDGKDTSLKAYKGKVLLIVNVASRCGNTPQYAALETAYEKYKKQGFEILAFPCNDFGAQEPGTADEIKTFCTSKYSVSFPLFAKIHVKGEEKHPLYAALTGPEATFPGDIEWNFTKFLVGRDGKVIKRFFHKTKPDSPEVIEAIEAALNTK